TAWPLASLHVFSLPTLYPLSHGVALNARAPTRTGHDESPCRVGRHVCAERRIADTRTPATTGAQKPGFREPSGRMLPQNYFLGGRACRQRPPGMIICSIHDFESRIAPRPKIKAVRGLGPRAKIFAIGSSGHSKRCPAASSREANERSSDRGQP